MRFWKINFELTKFMSNFGDWWRRRFLEGRERGEEKLSRNRENEGKESRNREKEGKESRNK